MLNCGMTDGAVDHALHQYFSQCSLKVNSQDLAMMAATLANMGIKPVTGKQVFGFEYVKDVLTVMFTCGLYDHAGEWAYRVGLPAKSGVGGGIVAVVNRQLGIAVYSPRLDAKGNSVRGILACRELASHLGLSRLRVHERRIEFHAVAFCGLVHRFQLPRKQTRGSVEFDRTARVSKTVKRRLFSEPSGADERRTTAPPIRFPSARRRRVQGRSWAA